MKKYCNECGQTSDLKNWRLDGCCPNCPLPGQMNQCRECKVEIVPALIYCGSECADKYMKGLAEEKLKEMAYEELENTLASYSESGRDMELCFPSIEEEEREMFLESVAEGDKESMAQYEKEQLDKKMKEVE